MASIEFDPENSEFPEGGWHLARYCGVLYTELWGCRDTARSSAGIPNVFQHHVSFFRLQDPTKPGHRRFIALWLLDLHKRITSTANVPPQQKDWWNGDKSGDSIPKGLMDVKEAREHRFKLMDERTAEKARRHWQSIGYNFCEH